MTAAVRRLVAPTDAARSPDYTPRLLPEDSNALPVVDGDDSVRLSHLGYVAETEHASSLSDILFARTGLGYRHRLSDAHIQKAAQAVSAHLGWNDAEIHNQVEAVKTRRDRLHQPAPDAE